MRLGEKQRIFTHCIAQLIIFAYSKGYQLTFGDAYRDPRLHGGMGEKKGYGRWFSCHKVRLAVDFNLFKPGKNGEMRYCTKTDDHKELGEFWESLHPLCRWGGHFNDGNHYSFEHNGRQ